MANRHAEGIETRLPQTHGVLEIVYHLNNSAEALPESLHKDWQALIKRAPLQQKVMALIQAEKKCFTRELNQSLTYRAQCSVGFA